jgi:hypothetical protein
MAYSGLGRNPLENEDDVWWHALEQVCPSLLSSSRVRAHPSSSSFDDYERGLSPSNTPPPTLDSRPRRYTTKHAPAWSDAADEPLTLAPPAQPMNTHQLLDRLLALAAADVSRARPTATFVHAALLLVRARLDAESTRAREAEGRANALVRRAKDAVTVRADAAGAREAVRVHADVAERAGAATRRVQAELARRRL